MPASVKGGGERLRSLSFEDLPDENRQSLQSEILAANSPSDLDLDALTPIRRNFISKPQTLFVSPEAAGRKIVFGFSYLQRVGRGAHTSVWFPPSLQEKIGERVLAGDTSVLDELNVEWAAVRQFELLQEAGNLAIEDLDVTHLTRSFTYLTKMRAGGHRVTLITLGRYVSPTHYDELRILDERLQQAITRFVQMIYLDEQSAASNQELATLTQSGQWNYAAALPHVAITLGAGQLFKPTRSVQTTAKFFQLLEMLPAQKVQHEVAVGLQLPEAGKRNTWTYIAPADKQIHAFQTALSTVFRGFDGLSLGGLHEREGAGREIKATMGQLRSYGDHMQSGKDEHYRQLAQMFRPEAKLH